MVSNISPSDSITTSNQVQFKLISREKYNALTVKDTNTLYFIYNEHMLYKGSQAYGGVQSITPTLDSEGHCDLVIVNGDGTTTNLHLISSVLQSNWNQTDTEASDYIKNKPENLSDFLNDCGFITKSVNDLTNYYKKTETYSQQEISALLSSINQFKYEIYTSLSDITIPKNNVLYLIGPSGEGEDKYEEYVYNNVAIPPVFVKIGDTTIDLSNYYTKSQVDGLIKNGKLSITFNGTDKGDFFANQSYNTSVVLEETDPTVSSHIKSITQQNISDWNNAQPNVIEEIQVNGTPAVITNKSVNISVPQQPTVVDNDVTLTWNTKTSIGSINSTDIHITLPTNPNTDTQADWNEADSASPAYINNKPTIPAAQINSDWSSSSGVSEILHKPTKVSDFSNDSGFITTSVNNLTNYYTKDKTYTRTEINTLIGNINQFKYEIYASISDITSPHTNVLYLIGPNTSVQGDQYEEYVYFNNNFIKIGDTSIDLSNYYTKSETNSTFVAQISGKGLSTEDYTSTEKTKLANIEAGAEVNVNADWNANSGDAQILNKPNLATVATSGDYNDLLNKPQVVNSNPTLAWGQTSQVGTVGGVALQVTMPSSGGGGASLSFDAGTVTANTSQCLLTVSTHSSQRTYSYGEITSSWATPSGTTRTVGLCLVLNNDCENYVLLHNNDSTYKMAVTISSIEDENNAAINNVIMPSNISDVSAGGYIEVSVVVRTINSVKYAVLTFSQEINL